MSNQDRYRPGHPRRARIAQTPRKPPIRRAGALRDPARRSPAQGPANASSYQSWFNIDEKGSLPNQDRRRSNQLVAQGLAIALGPRSASGKREAPPRHPIRGSAGDPTDAGSR